MDNIHVIHIYTQGRWAAFNPPTKCRPRFQTLHMIHGISSHTHAFRRNFIPRPHPCCIILAYHIQRPPFDSNNCVAREFIADDNLELQHCEGISGIRSDRQHGEDEGRRGTNIPNRGTIRTVFSRMPCAFFIQSWILDVAWLGWVRTIN